MNKTFLITLFAIALLFILFLYSGGLYSYSNNAHSMPQFRVSKITGNVQVLDQKGWQDVLKDKQNEQ